MALAALNHLNACSLYDVGSDYLVMEFVDGAPIKPVQNLRKLTDLSDQIADWARLEAESFPGAYL